MGQGLIHIYTGDGKGKTTAAVGLCIRYAGQGGRVLFGQFLKNDSSGELKILRQIPEITFLPSGKSFGFACHMDDDTKNKAKQHYTQYLEKLLTETETGRYGMIVLDEIIAADNHGFIPHERLISFLKENPNQMEIILTGRAPSKDLCPLASYISTIRCDKHPYTQKIAARKGIEF